MIKIFTLEIKKIPFDEKLLDDEEKERFQRIKDPIKAKIKASCRCAVKSILSQELRCDPKSLVFSYEEHGKPYLKGHPLHFNLSHSRDYLLLAYSSTGSIGVDSEFIDEHRDWRALEYKVLSERERDELSLLSNTEAREAFFMLWTQKEAFSKYQGKGLLQPFTDLDIGSGVSKKFQGHFLNSFQKNRTWFSLYTEEEVNLEATENVLPF